MNEHFLLLQWIFNHFWVKDINIVAILLLLKLGNHSICYLYYGSKILKMIEIEGFSRDLTKKKLLWMSIAKHWQVIVHFTSQKWCNRKQMQCLFDHQFQKVLSKLSIFGPHICLSRFWQWAKYVLYVSYLFSMIIKGMQLMRCSLTISLIEWKHDSWDKFIQFSVLN